MNQLSGAEAIVRMLQGFGVKHIFGLCGDTSLPLYDALSRLDHGMTHALARDERSAAYMADGYARVTGRVGVCEAPSGGGATYILPGLVEANESSIALLAITTDISVAARGRYALTELDQASLFRPITKWNAVLDRAADVPATLRAAFRQSTTGRPGAVHVGLPFDVQRDPVDEAEVWAEPAHGSFPATRTAPDAADAARAAEILRDADAPVIICGGGVVLSGGEEALVRLAQRLHAPVATTISGQGSIAEDHPLAVGVVGSNGGTPETRAVVDAADVIVFVGCRAGSVTTERWRHPAPGTARIVHIDCDPAVIGANYRTEAGVVGDARLALTALDDALAADGFACAERPIADDLLPRERAAKEAAFAKLAASEAAPIRPERVIAALQALLPDDAVVVADPGTPCPYVSAHYRFRRPGRHFLSNRAHGALGYALPAAMGAQTGRPNAKTVALMGDGSFGFVAGELETLARLDLPITAIVFSNASFGWIKAGQRAGYGERYFSVDFRETDHARIAEAYGVRAWRVTEPRDLAPALSAAIASDRPSLVDIVTQPLHEAAAPVSEWIA